MPENNPQDEDAAVEECIRNFYTIATIQGRIAYLLMSIHAVNPNILTDLLRFNPHRLLWYNMLYGITLHMYSRPNMRPLTPGHRMTFSLLGSLMFNYTSMKVFEYFAKNADERPYLMLVLSFIAGRTMMLHLLAYLYHVDTRAGLIRRDQWFDSIYT